MGLLNWLKSLRAEQIGGTHISQFQNRRPYSPLISHKALIDRYASYVYACVKLNSIACAKVPLRLYTARPTRGAKALFKTRSVNSVNRKWLESNCGVQRKVAKANDVEEVLDHPVLDLFDQVNEFMNGFDLFEGLYSFGDLTGNAYWYIIKNALGVPEAIWPLFPQFVKVVPSKENFILGYQYQPTPDNKMFFGVDEIIHFKEFSPKDAFVGMGALEAGVMAADLGESMNKYDVETFKNAGLADMAITIPVEGGKPDDKEIKRIQAQWRRKYAGIDNRGRIPVLTGGAKVENISFSPKEMAFLQGRKASLNEIATVFGVPLSMLTPDNVNKANAEVGERQHLSNTVLPKLRRVEQKLNEKLLPMYDESLFVVYDNPVGEDKEFRLKEIELKLRTNYSTINEQRQIDGQEPVEWGDEPSLPVNPAPVVPKKRAKSVKRLPSLEIPSNAVDKKFVSAMQEYFKEQQDDVIANAEKDANALKSIKVSGTASDFASSWFDSAKWNKRLEETLKPFLESTMFTAGGKALSSINSSLTFNPLNPNVANQLTKHHKGAIQINATTSKQVRKAISEALEEGTGIAGVKKRLIEVYGSKIESSAILIARTETIWAFNAGARAGYLQSGVITRIEWVSSNDDRSCDFCPDLDGKTIDIIRDENFFNKGDSLVGRNGNILKFDYEDIGHPPAHCMCRCAIAPITEGI